MQMLIAVVQYAIFCLLCALFVCLCFVLVALSNLIYSCLCSHFLIQIFLCAHMNINDGTFIWHSAFLYTISTIICN